MFEGFTPDARAVVDASQALAAEAGRAQAGTQDLLLALAESPVGGSATALGDLGVSAAQLRERVIEPPADGAAGEWNGRHAWTTPAKRLLEYSLRQRLQRSDPAIEPEHLLLASALVEEGGAYRILTELGVDFAAIQARVAGR